MTREEFNKLSIDDHIIINDIDHVVTNINRDQELLELSAIKLNEFSRMYGVSSSWYRYENVDILLDSANLNDKFNFLFG